MRGALIVLLGLVPLACIEIDPSYANVDESSGAASSTASDSSGATQASTNASAEDSTGPSSGTNIVFVTSTTTSANFGNLEAADTICNQLAQAAGLAGTYVAWLSDSSQDAITRVGSASGWVRTDGRVFARDRNALVSAQISYPPLLNETGALVTPTGVDFVFTGTDGTGVRVPETCNDWQSIANEDIGHFGYPDGGGGVWSSSGNVVCNAQGRFYCLGIDFDDPVELAPPPEGARLAFATNAQLPADAGRPAADELCASEATAAGHAGTFLALMAAPGETLWDRHDLSGPSWVRPDGVVAFSTETSLEQWGELIEAPLVLDARGSLILGIQFWSGVGTPTEVADATTTCDGWTDTTYPQRPTGWTIYANWLDPVVEVICDSERTIACLQE